jgi:hypothetical protein
MNFESDTMSNLMGQELSEPAFMHHRNSAFADILRICSCSNQV